MMTQGLNFHNLIQKFILNFIIPMYHHHVISQLENFINLPYIAVIKLLENFLQFVELIIDCLKELFLVKLILIEFDLKFM